MISKMKLYGYTRPVPGVLSFVVPVFFDIEANEFEPFIQIINDDITTGFERIRKVSNFFKIDHGNRLRRFDQTNTLELGKLILVTNVGARAIYAYEIRDDVFVAGDSEYLSREFTLLQDFISNSFQQEEITTFTSTLPRPHIRKGTFPHLLEAPKLAVMLGNNEGDMQCARVMNLPKTIDEQILNQIFCNFGDVVRIIIFRNRKSGLPVGHALVYMAQKNDLIQAVSKLNGMKFDAALIREGSSDVWGVSLWQYFGTESIGISNSRKH